MSENERLIHAGAADVFAVLTDGWSYAAWVVGASRVRDVDAGWPEEGHSIHHSVGAWPVLIDDTTTVLEYDPLRKLRLRVRAWPAGEGEVEFRVTETPEGCLVSMRERVSGGLALFVPPVAADLALRPRNTETLRRLALLVEKA